MSLQTFAKDELTRAGMFDADSDYGGMLGESVMKMIDAFADEGHSGFSAGMAISIFEKVARFQPLTPLTGADDEWNDVGEGDGGIQFQNRRCPTVFKDDQGAYDIARDRREPVTFPYSPRL